MNYKQCNRLSLILLSSCLLSFLGSPSLAWSCTPPELIIAKELRVELSSDDAQITGVNMGAFMLPIRLIGGTRDNPAPGVSIDMINQTLTVIVSNEAGEIIEGEIVKVPNYELFYWQGVTSFEESQYLVQIAQKTYAQGAPLFSPGEDEYSSPIEVGEESDAESALEYEFDLLIADGNPIDLESIQWQLTAEELKAELKTCCNVGMGDTCGDYSSRCWIYEYQYRTKVNATTSIDSVYAPWLMFAIQTIEEDSEPNFKLNQELSLGLGELNDEVNMPCVKLTATNLLNNEVASQELCVSDDNYTRLEHIMFDPSSLDLTGLSECNEPPAKIDELMALTSTDNQENSSEAENFSENSSENSSEAENFSEAEGCQQSTQANSPIIMILFGILLVFKRRMGIKARV